MLAKDATREEFRFLHGRGGTCGLRSKLLAVIRQNEILTQVTTRRGGRVVEGTSLENWRAGNGTEGSNPSLSANVKTHRTVGFYIGSCIVFYPSSGLTQQAV